MTAKPASPSRLRLGIDLGGTKIAGVVLDEAGTVLVEHRIPAPRDDYRATLAAIAEMVRFLEAAVDSRASIGIGMPGSMSPATGLVQNSNSTWLNGRTLGQDLEALLGRPVRLANDANCFALSEAVDGAGAGALSVFGAILGTGCGGGLVYRGALVDGPRGIGGEWGHTPLPWPEGDEHPGPTCWCGRRNCLEMWLSGTGLAADHARVTGVVMTAEQVAAAAATGDAAAISTLDRHARRLGRALAMLTNIFDPAVIVLGGGLSKLPHLYQLVPQLAAPYVFADHADVVIKPPVWGDAGGVRGAAWLWGGP